MGLAHLHPALGAGAFLVLHRRLRPRGARAHRLAGPWLSLLLDDTQDHFRLLLLNLARLALLDPSQLATDGVLLPAELNRVHREAVEAALAVAYERVGVPEALRVCLVGRVDGPDVERLLLPWQVSLGKRITPVGARFRRGTTPHGRHARPEATDLH